MNFFEAYQSCSLFGALRYFANIRDCVSLINGPMGCAFYARNAIVNLNGYFEAEYKVDIPKIFNLNFNESDVIFGNTNKIINAINEIVDKYSPKIVFLFNCCVSEVIGSDIDEIANTIHSTIVIPIHTAGFKGDHKFGMRLASQILCDKLMPPQKLKTNYKSVNILGEFDYFNRSTEELTNRLKQIGITNVQHIPGKSSLSEIRNSSSAVLNIISCQNASRLLAELMKNKYDIPYIGYDRSLYGIDNTFHFYKEIYNFFNITTEQLIRDKDSAFREIENYRSFFRNKRVAVVAGTRRALGYSSILKELGLDIVLLFSEYDSCYNKKDEFEIFSQNVYLNEFMDNLSEKLKELSPDVVFTTLPEMVAPEKYLARLSEDFTGFNGAIRLAKYLYEYFQKKPAYHTIFINN